MKDKYKPSDICSALDIKQECFRQWLKKEYIKPTYPSTASGISALFTKEDAFKIEMFKTLVERGFSRQVASNMLVWIYDSYRDNTDNILSYWKTNNQHSHFKIDVLSNLVKENDDFWESVGGTDLYLINLDRVWIRIEKLLKEI